MTLKSTGPYVIVGNYGNDTVALVQWAYEQKLSPVYVVSVDTGWTGAGWHDRVAAVEKWALNLGFAVQRLLAVPDFATLIQQRQTFPSTKFQWCASTLKGATLLTWLDKIDPSGCYPILLGHRRASACSKQNLPAHIPSSEPFGERTVYHPLVAFSTAERNGLLQRAGFTVLPHRSLECDPCVNSDLSDLARIAPVTLARQEKLENKLGKKMLSTDLIRQANVSDVLENMGCGDMYGCGI